MEVKFDNSGETWRLEDRNIVKLLAVDKTFNEVINKARLECKLDPVHLPEDFINANMYSISVKHARWLIEYFDLHKLWLHTLSYFIITGKLVSPGNGIYISGTSIAYNPVRKKFLHPDSFSLIVTEKTGFDNLIATLVERKAEINKILNDLPKRRNMINGIKYKIDIKRLMDEGKTIEEIFTYLTENYPKIDFDIIHIRNWMRRIEQHLKGFKLT